VSQDAVPPSYAHAQIAGLRAQIDARDRVIAMLRAQLARLRRMTFGTSSEKLAREIEQLELALEEYEAEAASAGLGRNTTCNTCACGAGIACAILRRECLSPRQSPPISAARPTAAAPMGLSAPEIAPMPAASLHT